MTAQPMPHTVVLLLGLLVFAQIADAYTTIRVLRQGGRELNPVMRYLIEHLGMLPAMLLKVTVIALLGYQAMGMPLVLAAVTAVSFIPVLINLRNLR